MTPPSILEALQDANAAAPPGWTIELRTERTFAFRQRYTIVALRAGRPLYSWPGVYDVVAALPGVVHKLDMTS